jgi:hypothetical protein
MKLPRFNLRNTLKRWAWLVQLSCFEANNGRTATRRMSGINRSKRVVSRYALLAASPWLLVIIPDALGHHRGVAWWMLASTVGAWGVSVMLAMLAAMVLSIRRDARVRIATDRGKKARYPRKHTAR